MTNQPPAPDSRTVRRPTRPITLTLALATIKRLDQLAPTAHVSRQPPLAPIINVALLNDRQSRSPAGCTGVRISPARRPPAVVLRAPDNPRTTHTRLGAAAALMKPANENGSSRRLTSPAGQGHASSDDGRRRTGLTESPTRTQPP
jgi:hypothetical protein